MGVSKVGNKTDFETKNRSHEGFCASKRKHGNDTRCVYGVVKTHRRHDIEGTHKSPALCRISFQAKPKQLVANCHVHKVEDFLPTLSCRAMTNQRLKATNSMFLLLLCIICLAAACNPMPCAAARDHDWNIRPRKTPVHLDVMDLVMVAKRLCRRVA